MAKYKIPRQWKRPKLMASNKNGGPRKTQKLMASKRKSQEAKVDRISSLPDEILSHILSLFPTKCAVGTSILSNRWKYLWTSLTSFDLKGPPYTNSIPKIVDFACFVDKVFRSCTTSQIQKFSLHVSWGDKNRVTSWINKVIKHNAKEVDIDVHDLPLKIFSFKAVSVLTISVSNWNITDKVSFDLPCLRVLHVKWKYYCKGLQKLISNCPVLEDHTLTSYPECKSSFKVSSPLLKSLRIQPNNNFRSPTILYVNAPNLEYLHLDVDGVKHLNIEGDFSSLIKASVIINKFHQGFNLPEFQNLTCLEVVVRDSDIWVTLPKLLMRSPSLEILTLEQGESFSNYEYDWVEPNSVPNCFGFNLAVIKIKGFKGKKHELQLIKYCLYNAKVLKSLSINCGGLTQVEETKFCGQLLKLSRASVSCHINFHGAFISNI